MTKKYKRKLSKMLVTAFVLMAVLSINAASYDGYYEGVSSGKGSGGQGVITKEPFDNILKSETVEKDLTAGIWMLYPFISPELSIYELYVKSKESETYVAIRIEDLKDTSKIAKEKAPINIYKNENVWLGSSNIDDITVRFRVENSWISNNNVNREDIRLLKWDNVWTPLGVKEINRDDNYTYFESRITESSILAIGSKGENETLPISTPIMTGNATPIQTESPLPTKSAPAKSPGFEIIAAITVITAIYIFRRNEKEMKKK